MTAYMQLHSRVPCQSGCMQARCAPVHCCLPLQVKLGDPDSCLDSLFVFSLVWSIGASCDRASAVKFDSFLRQLLAGTVQATADRTDVDLGPGLAITYPEQLYTTPLPKVRAICVR